MAWLIAAGAISLLLFLPFFSFFFTSFSGNEASSSFGLSLKIREMPIRLGHLGQQGFYTESLTAHLLRRASLPMLPIFLIIMLADDTVEANEILSVDMFFILNRLLFVLSFVISLGAIAVRSVVARLISLAIAAVFTKGGEGLEKFWEGVVGGVAESVEVSDGEV